MIFHGEMILPQPGTILFLWHPEDFILWLDADDVILPKEREKFMERRKALDLSVSIVMMRYDAAFDEKGNPTFSYYRERLVNRRMNFQWVGEVHEVIPLKGKVEHWDVAVEHRKIIQNDPGAAISEFCKIWRIRGNLWMHGRFFITEENFWQTVSEEGGRGLNSISILD